VAMFITVDAEFILASLLLAGEEPISVRKLKSFRDKIYHQLVGENVFFDITGRSVCSVVENNPQMFAWRDDQVIKAKNSEKYFSREYISENIGWHLPEEIREKVLEVGLQSI